MRTCVLKNTFIINNYQKWGHLPAVHQGVSVAGSRFRNRVTSDLSAFNPVPNETAVALVPPPSDGI